MNNPVYLFDVDSTLTPARQPMDSGFSERFLEWAKDKEYYLISGSDKNKLTEQLPEKVLNRAESVFTCAGNEQWTWQKQKGAEVPPEIYGDIIPILQYKNEWVPSPALLEHIQNQFKWATWQKPLFPPHIEYRQGMINVSIIGRGCTQEWRDTYDKFSTHDGELLRLANSINETFPDVHCEQGGQISLDCYPVGKDKRQVLDHIDLSSSSCVFYGDKIENGNDRGLAIEIAKRNCGTSVQVQNWQHLESLLGLTPVALPITIPDSVPLAENPDVKT